ncbi:MAG: hypothetical protein LBL76_06225, partial [Treponema sp.]|nr:hypothetical protein [Treponema sp.]
MPYKDVLEFQDEVQLNTRPLRIDALIIKKKPEAVIDRKLAALFKTANILEYKSPSDMLSIDDFNRTLAYCFLYTAIERIGIEELSLSIVVERKPVKVLNYLKEVCRWEVTEQWPGVHIIEGLPFKIQVIERGQVEEREGLWLRELHGKHSGESLSKVLEDSRGYANEEYLKVYLNILLQANPKGVKEITEMARETLEEVLIQTGVAASLEARVRAEDVKEVLAILRNGTSLEEIENM